MNRNWSNQETNPALKTKISKVLDASKLSCNVPKSLGRFAVMYLKV